jgi:hypothetical protein
MEKEKSVLRNKSIGTKVSDEEYGELEKLAEARGLTLSEWFRELVLAEMIAHPAEQTILAEVLALRAIVLNCQGVSGVPWECIPLRRRDGKRLVTSVRFIQRRFPRTDRKSLSLLGRLVASPEIFYGCLILPQEK